MAIAYGAASTITYTPNAGATTVTPTLPAGYTTGNLLVIAIGTKPDTATPTTPAGWSLGATASGGTGTTGIDTGPTRVTTFFKVATSASETAPTITITNNNISWAQSFYLTSGSGFDVAAASGADTTTGTAWSVTCSTDPGLTAGDFLFVFTCISTDASTWSGQGMTATGVSAFGTWTEINEFATSNANDLGGYAARGSVTTGTSTAAPVITATAAGTTTNTQGVSQVLRVREATNASVSATTIARTVAVGSPTVTAVNNTVNATTISRTVAVGSPTVTAGGGSTPPAFVQVISNATTGANIGATLSAAPTTGNLLIAVVSQQAITNIWTAQNSWNILNEPLSGDQAAIFWKLAGASEPAAQVVTTTDQTSRQWSCIIAEYSGIAATGTLLAQNGATSTAATKTSPSITPTAGVPALVIGAAFTTSFSTTFSNETVNSSTTGVTERAEKPAGTTTSNGTVAVLWDAVVTSTTGSYTVSVDASLGESGGVMIAMFQGSGTGGGGGSTDATVNATTISRSVAIPSHAVSDGQIHSVTIVFISDTHAGVNTDAHLTGGAQLALDQNPDRIVMIGDLADSGLSSEYALLNGNWGSTAVRAKMKAVPGNHDYLNDIVAGYETYLGSNAFPAPLYYGAEEINGWHIIYLNLCTPAEFDQSTDPQRVWLTNYLNAHMHEPMVALWHHMPFSGGQFAPGHLFHATFGPGMTAVYDELAAAGCEIIMAGHDHSYQRFARLDSSGAASSTGMRSIVVGTSNNNYFASHSVVNPTLPEVYNSNSAFLGVTKLVLYSDHYTWQFVPATGTTFTDFGSENVRYPISTASTASPFTISGVVTLDAATPAADLNIAATTIGGAVTLPAPAVGMSATISGTTINGAATLSPATVGAGTGLAATTISQAVTVPTSTQTISTSSAPATVAGAVTVPTAVESTGATHSATAISRLVAIGSPATSANTAVAGTTVNGVTSVGVPTPTIATSVAATTISRLVVVGPHAAGSGQTLTATTIAGATTVPAPTLGQGTGVAATTISQAVAVPTPSVSAGGSAGVSPATITGIAAMSMPLTSINLSFTPSTINGAVAVGVPSVGFSQSVAGTTISRLVSIPAPTESANTAAAPSTIAPSVVSFPAATKSAATQISSTTVSGAVTLPTPGISAGGSASTSPATITGTVSTPASTPSAAGFVLAAAVAGIVSIGSATLVAGQGASPTPTTVSQAVVVGTATPSAQSNITATTISRVVVVPSTTTSANTGSTPATISRQVVLDAPVVGAGQAVPGATISRAVVMPAAALSLGAGVSGATITRLVSIPTPTEHAGTNVSVGTIAGSTILVFGQLLYATNAGASFVDASVTGASITNSTTGASIVNAVAGLDISNSTTGAELETVEEL